MKIGIVFAGQGAQYSGMGKDLYDSYPQAKEIFDLAGDQIKEWCFEGDAETLKQTHVTQPTIYTVSMAAYKALLAELEKNGLSDKLGQSSSWIQPGRILCTDGCRGDTEDQRRRRDRSTERNSDAGGWT